MLCKVFEYTPTGPRLRYEGPNSRRARAVYERLAHGFFEGYRIEQNAKIQVVSDHK